MNLSPEQVSARLLEVRDNDGIFQLTTELQDFLIRVEDSALFPVPLTLPQIHPSLVIHHRKGTGRCVIANSKIEAGEIILSTSGSRISKPIRCSWQIDEHIHRIGPGLIDHSCGNPGCGIDPDTSEIVTIRKIKPGEIVTFNYLTTEYDLSSPFTCKCGEADCYGRIKGFKYLSVREKNKLRDRFPLAKYLLRYMV